MMILKKVPKCCFQEIDLIAVEDKKLYFQCKRCGKVVIEEEDLE